MSLPFATNTFTGNGTTTVREINFAGGYIDRAHVKCKIKPVTGAEYEVPLTWIDSNTVATSVPAPVGSIQTIYRDTPKGAPLVDFTDGAAVNELNLDRTTMQSIFAAAENSDRMDAIQAHDNDIAGARADAVAAVDADRVSSLAAIDANRTSSLTAVDTARTTAVSAVNAAKDAGVAAVNTASTAATGAIATQKDAALAAVAAAGDAGPRAVAALVGFTDADLVLGSAPTSGSGGITGKLWRVPGTAPVDRTLKQIRIGVFAIGDGSMTIKVSLPNSASTVNLIRRYVVPAGTITATGLATLVAGVHFPADILVPAGASVWAGSGATGIQPWLYVTSSETLSESVTGSTDTISPFTYGCLIEATLQVSKTVASVVTPLAATAAAAADAISGTVLETLTVAGAQAYGVNDFTGYGDQGITVPLSTAYAVRHGGMYLGFYYKGVAAGPCTVDFWRPIGGGAYKRIGGQTVNITVGNYNYAAMPIPFRVEAGDIEVVSNYAGRVATRSWGNPYSLNFQGGYDYSSTTPALIPRQPAIRGIVQRQVTTKEIVAEARYGTTSIVRESFLGTSTPTNWTAPATGTAYNNGIVATGAGSYLRYNLFDKYSNAERKTLTAHFVMTDATASVGIYTMPQDGSLLPMGTMALLDATAGASAAVLRMHTCGVQSAAAPTYSNVSVPLGFTIVAGQRYVLTLVKRRGRLTFTVTDPISGTSTVLRSVFGTAAHGGLAWGKPGVIQPAGNSTCTFFGFNIDIGNRPLAIMFPDSNGEGDYNMGELFDLTYANQISDLRGKGDILNCGRAGSSSDETLQCLDIDLDSFTPTYALWLQGTNASPGADTNARVAQWRADTATFISRCTARGIIPVLTTYPPYDLDQARIAAQNADIRNHYFGPYRYIEVNYPLSTNNAGAVWVPELTADKLHANPIGHDRWARQFQIDFPELFN